MLGVCFTTDLHPQAPSAILYMAQVYRPNCSGKVFIVTKQRILDGGNRLKFYILVQPLWGPVS